MKVCIHQPDFAPYLGFFRRLIDCDTYIAFDDVQFLRRGWHHRDKIKTRSGTTWLTLPTRKADYAAAINEIELDPDTDAWIPKHLNLLKENYAGCTYFDSYFSALEGIYNKRHRRLIDFNLDVLNFFLAELEIEIKTVFSSQFGVTGEKNDRLTTLVRAVGGDHYITGTGSRDYIDADKFKQAGITLEIQKFDHPVYPQAFGDFIPYLSGIDAIMNCGPELKEIVHSY